MKSTDSGRPLVRLADFRKSGRCPINVYHAISRFRDELLERGALIRWGSCYLVDEPEFFAWLRDNSRRDSGPDAGGAR
jgi:hypothetical protein